MIFLPWKDEFNAMFYYFHDIYEISIHEIPCTPNNQQKFKFILVETHECMVI